MKTQHLESLIIESTCCHKPLLKSSELLLLLLLLLRHDDKPMEVERTIVSSGEVGRAAPPYVIEIR
jgi:hypothetical protein